jgi:hypothetical protein
MTVCAARKRSRMRAGVLATVLMAAACGDDGGATSSAPSTTEVPASTVTIRINTTSPTTTAASNQPKAIPSGRLGAGTYVAKGFDPELTFEVPAETFATTEPVTSESFFLQAVDPLHQVGFNVVRVGEVFTDFLVQDPIQLNHVGKVSPPPADLIAWLRQNPYLNVGPEQSVTIGGKAARRVLVTTKPLPQGQGGCRSAPKRCVTLIHSKLEKALYYGILEGESEEVTIIDMPGGPPLMFSIGPVSDAPKDQKFLQDVHSLLGTVKFP